MIDVIINSELSSVEFVKDYIQLRFEGPCLTAITKPQIITDGGIMKWDDPGYRDSLCDLIGQNVKDVSVRYGEAVEILFDSGIKIRISLKDEDYRGPEAVKFDGLENDWFVI